MSAFPGVGYSPDPGEISDFKLTDGFPLDLSRDPWPRQWYGGTGVPRLAQVKPEVLDVPAIEARYGTAPQPPPGSADAGTVILPMSAGTIGNTYHESDAASFLRELWLIDPNYFRPGGDGFPTFTEVCDLLATSVRGSGARLIAHWLSLPHATRPDFVPDPWATLMAMEHWNRIYWDQWLKAHGVADLIPKATELVIDIVRREGAGADFSSGETGSSHFPPTLVLDLWDRAHAPAVPVVDSVTP